MFSKNTRFPLVPRKKNTDKSHYGHVLVVAGSRVMTGAPQLVGRACLSSGAGLVTVAVPKSALASFSKKALSELMCLELPETAQGTLAADAYSRIMDFVRARAISCVAIGPGLSHKKSASALVRRLMKNLKVPIVLDADGLNAYKGKSAQLREHRAPLIVTPHSGEFERLFSEKWPKHLPARVLLAKKLSRFYDVTIVLKGHRTLVVQNSRVYENRTGNPGMAKGGSGDVLTGIIGAFVA